ncbi:ABC transporter ATP-binding protein, partial [Rhizobiaceae sp. 2RAB30]
EAPEAPKGPAKKLSYKQKFALETLPKKMEETSAVIAGLEKKLADPVLFTRDPTTFNKTVAALDKERAGLAAMEEEWLELEMLREEIEGA